MRWYNFIAFKNIIFMVTGVRSSDGLEGRKLFLSGVVFNCLKNLSPFSKLYK